MTCSSCKQTFGHIEGCKNAMNHLYNQLVQSPEATESYNTRISYSTNRFGHYEVYRLDNEDETVLFQTDWDFPGLASTFGWQACPCGATDGTVDCAHKTVSEMIMEASEYLDANEGKIVEDPGYFD